MEYKNLATIINTVTENRLGKAVTVAEDLSNIADVGTAIGDIDDDTFKSFWSDIVIGVGVSNNLFMNKEYKPETFGIVKTSKELGGARQRIACKTIMPALEDKALTLVTGQNYLDDVYHGFDVDARVYTQSGGYEIPYSITRDAIMKCFVNVNDVEKMIAQFITMVNTSKNIKEKGLVDALVCRAIVDTILDGRYIDLIASYNSEFGVSKTKSQIYADDFESARYKAYVKEVIGLVRDGFVKMSSKFNNGDYPTFSNDSDIKLILNSKFANRIERFTYGHDNRDTSITLPKYETSICWQNDGVGMLPDETLSRQIVDTDATYDNVVGVMYDNDALTVVNEFRKTTSDYFGSGDFTTYHNKMSTAQEFYPCANMVVFTEGAPTTEIVGA